MKPIYKLIPLISLILIGCTTAQAPKAPKQVAKGDYTYVKEYMRWYIKEQMEENDIVGLSIALVDDQKIVWQEGFGYADKKNNIKATAQTHYQAGSISKLFTGMGVMKLSEKGKIDIDKPLKTYLPKFSIKSRFGSTNGITPRTIMTHHSGLPGDWLDGMFAKNPIPYTQHVNLIKNEYVAYPPNTIMSYSNLGITLLGHAVEKVANEPFTNYIETNLLNPLAMNNSSFTMTVPKKVSKSYRGGEEIFTYPIGEIPAGGLETTVSDLSHLAMMVNAHGKYKNKEVLKSSTLTTMFTVQNEHIELDMGRKIGLSWFIDEKTLGKTNTIYSHGGATLAHRAMFMVEPTSKLGVVVLANSAESNSGEIAKTLLKKAWEAKMGKAIPKVLTQKNVNKKSYDFEGVYASIIGKVKVEKTSDHSYKGYSANGNFSLKRDNKEAYKVKYLLWSFIPLSDDDLESINFYTQTIDHEEVLIGDMNNSRFIAGVKVKPKAIPESWEKYVGRYKIINQFEPKEFQVKKITAKIEDGFPILEIETVSGDKIVEILNIVNDTEAIVEGLGRSKRETIYMKDGIFHYRGLKFRKVDNEK